MSSAAALMIMTLRSFRGPVVAPEEIDDGGVPQGDAAVDEG
jgi:hypothetical protein